MHLLPFFIVYAPVLVLRPEGGAIISSAVLISMFLAVASLQIGISRYCYGIMGNYERYAFAASGVLCTVFVFTKGYVFFVIGLAVFALFLSKRLIASRRLVH